jgi:hypothetical protein
MVFLVSTAEEFGFRGSDMVFNIAENDIKLAYVRLYERHMYFSNDG